MDLVKKMLPRLAAGKDTRDTSQGMGTTFLMRLFVTKPMPPQLNRSTMRTMLRGTFPTPRALRAQM